MIGKYFPFHIIQELFSLYYGPTAGGVSTGFAGFNFVVKIFCPTPMKWKKKFFTCRINSLLILTQAETQDSGFVSIDFLQ